MPLLQPIFQTTSLIFAFASIYTGLQARFFPREFARSFGIPVPGIATTSPNSGGSEGVAAASPSAATTEAYISLRGARQLSTGLTLLVLAYQGQWAAMAVVMAVAGVVVAAAGDGVVLGGRFGRKGEAVFHGVPGVGISALAIGFLANGGGGGGK